MIFIIQIQKAKTLEEKKIMTLQKQVAIYTVELKNTRCRRETNSFQIFRAFSLQKQVFNQHKNMPPHWGWQQQHSCCSRERTEQGRLSGAVTATSTTRDTSKVALLPENENSLQWYNVYNFKFSSLIILIRQLPYQENMSKTKMRSTEYIC